MGIHENLIDEVRKMMGNDPAHDFEHVMRVCMNARMICRMEDVDNRLVLCAALLHDMVSYPKSDRRSRSSAMESAMVAKTILNRHGFSDEDIKIVSGAICDHSFSGGAVAKTTEAMILQDADRLDALGAVGLARVFSTGGMLGRRLYNSDDPFCKNRAPDDTVWTVDHFFQKLLKLELLMNTESGKTEAKKRTRLLREYLIHLDKEIHP